MKASENFFKKENILKYKDDITNKYSKNKKQSFNLKKKKKKDIPF